MGWEIRDIKTSLIYHFFVIQKTVNKNNTVFSKYCINLSLELSKKKKKRSHENRKYDGEFLRTLYLH